MDNYGYAQLHESPIDLMKKSKKITAETLIGEGRKPFLTLNGEWNHSPDIYDAGLRAHWYLEKGGEFERSAPKDYDFEKWEPIHLPCSWNTMKSEYALYEGSMWFFRKIPKIEVSYSDRIILRIGAANYFCMIFLNKNYLGCHEGGFTPFCIDITDFLGEENRFLLWVNNTRMPEYVPGEYTDWMNYGGIFRSIELYKVPAIYIKNHFISYSRDANGQAGRITLQISLNQQVKENLKISIEGLLEKELELNEQGCGVFQLSSNPRLWSPEDPYLYRYTISCGKDTVSGSIGFRYIERKGKDLYLNGKKIFLKGITAHEESYLHGRALTIEEQRSTLLLAKEMNCNFIRLAHYPHSENMTLLADKIGILVWEELPIYWAVDFKNPDTLANARNQLEELILRDRNRASVIAWSVGNENPDTEDRFVFLKNLISLARKLDSTRLISIACLIDIENQQIKDRIVDEVDLVGVNEYFGWYYSGYDKLKRLLTADIDKPIIISEFGADAVCGLHSDSHDVWSEEYQEEVYRNQLKVILEESAVAGVTPWLLYDFKSPRRLNAYQRMYNLKGLLDRTKTNKKKAFYLVQEIYKELS